jgi:hypothetical protein
LWRTSRSFGWALVTMSATFVYLWVSVREPTHPGSLVALVIAATAALGAHFIVRGQRDAWAAVAGAGVAALALTKINVGCYTAIAVAAFAALHSDHAVVRRWAPWLVAVGFGVLPFALMRAHLDSPWAFTYAVLFCLGSFGVVGAATEAARSGSILRITNRQLAIAIAAGALVAILVLGVVMPRGTSFGDLADGVLLRPLRHQRFFFSMDAPALAVLLTPAVASCMAVAAALHFRNVARGIIEAGIVGLRVAAAAAVLALFVALPKNDWAGTVLCWLIPWLWVFIWPIAGEHGTAVASRAWLGIIALGQWLHAYPVPGSQIAWGTFLALPLSLWAAWDAGRWIVARAPERLRSRPAVLALRTSIWATAALIPLPLVSITPAWRQARPLNLPGTAGIRLPDMGVANYRVLSLNAAAHADTLFSLPGMFSFNLWTGLRTPTLCNSTQWWLFLTTAEQKRIITALEADPRACIVVDTYHLDYLRGAGLWSSGMLYDFVQENFAPAFTIDQFEFRVRKGRRIAPFFTAELLERTNAARDSGSLKGLLRLPIIPFPGQKIARIEIVSVEDPTHPRLVLDGSSAQCEVTPITTQGDAVGPAAPADFPVTVTSPALLAVHFDSKDTTFYGQRTLFVLRDEKGAELALARLRQ